MKIRAVSRHDSRRAHVARNDIIAVVTGLWLFSVKPDEYLENDAFLWKAVLLSVALANIAIQHRGAASRIGAGVSITLWLSVLIAGRWIGFV